MTTVKEFKEGAELSAPIYVTKPYVVLGNNGHGGDMVLIAGDIQHILKACNTTYYDHCKIEIRQYDLHLSDNRKLDGTCNHYPII